MKVLYAKCENGHFFDANSIEKIRFFIKVPFTKKRSVKSEPLSIIFIR